MNRCFLSWLAAIGVGAGSVLLALVGTTPCSAAPPLVFVTRATEMDVGPHQNFIGRIEATQTVEIRSRVTGIVAAVFVRIGESVKKGDLLFEVEAATYKSALDRASAELEGAQAHLKRIDVDVQRLQKLLPAAVVSREELDKATLERDEAMTVVKVREIAVEQAKLNLDATRVRTPIAGRVGQFRVQVGNLVKGDAQAQVLATVLDTSSFSGVFSIDEGTLVQSLKLPPDESRLAVGLPVRIRLTGESGFPHQASVQSIDPHIDPATGTARVRAVLPVEGGKGNFVILPGMSAALRLPLGKQQKALVIPLQARGVTGGGELFVWVVNDKNRIEQRAIKGDDVIDDELIVKEGLKPGDRIIADVAAMDLKPGDEVDPR